MPPSRTMPANVEGHVRPYSFKDGEAITIEVIGATHLAGKVVNVVLMELNAVDTDWVLQAPMELDQHGHGTLDLPNGLILGHEASVYVSELLSGEGEETRVAYTFPKVHVSIANAPAPVRSLGDIPRLHVRIVREQEATYNIPLGNPAEPGAIEHRVMSVVQGLYITTPLRLPGIDIRPIKYRPSGTELRSIVNTLLEELGWPSRIGQEVWTGLSQARNPLTQIVCNHVWAQSYERAGEIAREARDRIISLMAINRGATGQPVCLIIEQRQPDNTVVSKWAHEEPHYSGNLAGGFISGESQRLLLTQYRTVTSDPLVKLCCDLYGEALQDRSIDARFLRFWSILELLSGARMPSDDLVTLRDGSPWPKSKATTRFAKPRVYRYLAGILDRRSIDEPSVVSPAADLYEAVCVWYARRNATGHYGRLVVGDTAQMAQAWYPAALQSLTPDEPPWVAALQEAVRLSIGVELTSTRASGP